jgi:hypothetical protein
LLSATTKKNKAIFFIFLVLPKLEMKWVTF